MLVFFSFRWRGIFEPTFPGPFSWSCLVIFMLSASVKIEPSSLLTASPYHLNLCVLILYVFFIPSPIWVINRLSAPFCDSLCNWYLMEVISNNINRFWCLDWGAYFQSSHLISTYKMNKKRESIRPYLTPQLISNHWHFPTSTLIWQVLYVLLIAIFTCPSLS